MKAQKNFKAHNMLLCIIAAIIVALTKVLVAV